MKRINTVKNFNFIIMSTVTIKGDKNPIIGKLYTYSVFPPLLKGNKKWMLYLGNKLLFTKDVGEVTFGSIAFGRTYRLVYTYEDVVSKTKGKAEIALVPQKGEPQIIKVHWEDSARNVLDGKTAQISYLEPVFLIIDTANIPKGEKLEVTFYEDEYKSGHGNTSVEMDEKFQTPIRESGRAEIELSTKILEKFMEKANANDLLWTDSVHDYYVRIRYNDKINVIEDKAQLKVKNKVEFLPKLRKSAHVVTLDEEDAIKNTDIITYHIYQDGHIEKYIPQKEVFLASYFYHESSGVEHHLGIVNFQKKNWRNTSGSEKKKGRDGQELSYCELTNYINLSSYSSGNVKFKMFPGSLGSKRYYIDTDALACLIGALIELSIEDLFFSGFSVEDGNTAGGSSSHLNGMVGDFGYFNKNKKPSNTHITLTPDVTYPELNPSYDYEREKKFCDALHKFGYARYNGRRLLTENVYEKVDKKYENRILPHAQHYAKARHYHHLHIQGLKLSDVLIIKPI
ncbi:hypothetical protein AGMMS50239_32990 [Bacteroidia bacterium]|nr:hypothetical protein AGMMS50239_32990 [Bacteroidia bacterium]